MRINSPVVAPAQQHVRQPILSVMREQARRPVAPLTRLEVLKRSSQRPVVLARAHRRAPVAEGTSQTLAEPALLTQIAALRPLALRPTLRAAGDAVDAAATPARRQTPTAVWAGPPHVATSSTSCRNPTISSGSTLRSHCSR
jgi:hypothetical protein